MTSTTSTVVGFGALLPALRRRRVMTRLQMQKTINPQTLLWTATLIFPIFTFGFLIAKTLIFETSSCLVWEKNLGGS